MTAASVHALPVRLAPGVAVTPNLTLVRRIGAGGMGSIWVAHNARTNGQVAMKFANGQAMGCPDLLERFQREIEIAARLSSPHVATTYDSGTLADGAPYIVMELLKGESLHERLRRGPLSLEETTMIVSQSALALSELHAIGGVHRDVKPANLFLVDTGYNVFVKLLDFGIAKYNESDDEPVLTMVGDFLGSGPYMSREHRIAPESVDHRADLWSLAVVAYRCLAGRLPFPRQKLAELFSRSPKPHVVLTTFMSGLPPAIDAWFLKAFSLDIDERYQSAKEMALALESCLGGRVILPRARLPTLGETQCGLARAAAVKDDSTVTRRRGMVSADRDTVCSSAGVSPLAPSLAVVPLTDAQDDATLEPAITAIATAPGRKYSVRPLGIALVMVAIACIAGYGVLRHGSEERPSAAEEPIIGNVRATSLAATSSNSAKLDLQPQPQPPQPASASPSSSSPPVDRPNAEPTAREPLSPRAGKSASDKVRPVPTVLDRSSRKQKQENVHSAPAAASDAQSVRSRKRALPLGT